MCPFNTALILDTRQRFWDFAAVACHLAGGEFGSLAAAGLPHGDRAAQQNHATTDGNVLWQPKFGFFRDFVVITLGVVLPFVRRNRGRKREDQRQRQHNQKSVCFIS